MIRVKGHTISTVVVSTILGHYGDGMFPLYLKPIYRRAIRIIKETNTTVLSKSSTRLGRIGNYHPWKPWTWDCILDIPNKGMLNVYGLTNKGVASCAEGINSAIEKDFNVVPNFSPEFGDDVDKTIRQTIQAIEILHNVLGIKFWAIEINYSCPNDKSKIKDNIAKATKHASQIRKAFPWLVIIAKTSIVHPYEFLQELENIGIDVLHLINSIPFEKLFSGKSPLYRLGGGGVSGGPAFESALKYTVGASKLTKVPLMVGCGIVTIENFLKYREETRAGSFSICTGLKRNTSDMITLIKTYANRR